MPKIKRLILVHVPATAATIGLVEEGMKNRTDLGTKQAEVIGNERVQIEQRPKLMGAEGQS